MKSRRERSIFREKKNRRFRRSVYIAIVIVLVIGMLGSISFAVDGPDTGLLSTNGSSVEAQQTEAVQTDSTEEDTTTVPETTALGISAPEVSVAEISVPGVAEPNEQTMAAVTFTVTFADWDGTPISTQKVSAGTGAAAPSPPSREGYEFTGWSADFGNVQSDMVIQAQYKRLQAFTVSIQYSFLDGKTAAQPYIASIPKGEGLNDLIAHPTVSGYMPQPVGDYTQSDTESYTQNSLQLNISSIDKDHTYNVTYIPDNTTEYKVHYHLPKLPPATDYETITLEFTGVTGATVAAPAKEFEGFTPPANMPEAVLASDGSTEMDVNYTRKQVTLYFDPAGGSYVEPVYGLYGSAVTPPANPQKQGAMFLSWNQAIPATMPAMDMDFLAQWDEPDTADYTVKYWLENPNDDGYSFLYGEVRQGKVGHGNGTGMDDLALDNNNNFWAPPAYYPNMIAVATNEPYKLFYKKDATKIAEENEGIVITTDGAAVFNVYHTRMVTKFTFDFGSDYYIIHNGQKYLGTEYNFSVKFGGDVSALWPGTPMSDNPTASLNFDAYVPSANSSVLVPIVPRQTIPALAISQKSGNYYYPQDAVTLRLRTTDLPMIDYFVGLYVEPIGGSTDHTNHSDYVSVGTQQFHIPQGSKVIMSPMVGFGPPDPSEFTGVANAKTYMTRLRYNVNFYSGGQKINTESGIWYQEPLAIYDYSPSSPPVSMPGYTFDGWFTSPLLLEETRFDFGGGHTMPPSDLTLYAKWNKPVFDVKFAPQNGEPSFTDQYEYGEIISWPENPKRQGYRFMGWRESNKDYLYMTGNPVIRELELVGVWQPVSGASYTVRYINAENNTALEADRFVTGKQAGSTITEIAREISGFLPDSVSKSIILGQDGSTDAIIFKYTPFDSVNYIIHYQSTNGDELHKSNTKSTGNTIVTENFVRIPGYYPVNTQIRLQLSANQNENVITFQYAKGSDVVYTVEHYLQNLNGIGYYPHPSGPDTLSSPAGATVSPAARTVTGFALNKTVSDSEKIVNSSGTTVLRLYYDRNKYTIKFIAQTGGSLEGVQSFGKIPYGTQFKDAVTVPSITPEAGYIFNGWSPSLPRQDAIVEKDITYIAQFNSKTPETFTISYDANGGTGVMTPDNSLKNGAEYKIKGNEFQYTNHIFTGWGNSSLSGVAWHEGQTITVNGNLTLYAQWQEAEAPPTATPTTPGQPENPPTTNPTNPTTPGQPGNPPTTNPTTPGEPEPQPSDNTPSPNPGTNTTDEPEATPVIPGGTTNAPPQPPSNNQSGNNDGAENGNGVIESDQTYEETRNRTFQQMKEDGVPMITIGDNEVPLFGFGYEDVWALLNLILAIAGAVIGVILIVSTFIKKRQDENDEETVTQVEQENGQKDQNKKHIGWRITALAAGIAGIVAFLLTEDTNNLLVIFTDNWTFLMVLLFIPTVVSAIVVGKKKAE